MDTDSKRPSTSRLLQWRWQRRGLLRSNAGVTKFWKAVLFVIVVLTALHSLDRIQESRVELANKYTSTKFDRFSPGAEESLTSLSWQWEHGQPATGAEDQYSREHIFARRREWKQLGQGFEGKTFRYQGHVIKVFDSGRAPLRNCVPDFEPWLRWPTEIPASLILGGLAHDWDRQNSSGFLPVVDYFLSPDTGGQAAEWHFVTPFLQMGNLERLARQLRKSGASHSPRELDAMFRSSLERLMQNLGEMHTGSGLCHDDVKMENIFIESPPLELDSPEPGLDTATNWLLGDLGNVRELEHPYHSSRLWSQSGNLPDCRANDVLRLLKVYMTFLRASMTNTELFDAQFIQDSHPWSRLFWSVHEEVRGGRNPSADWAVKASRSHGFRPADEPADSPHADHEQGGRLGLTQLVLAEHSITRHWAVTQTLRVGAGDKMARRWGLVSLLGVPQGRCSISTL